MDHRPDMTGKMYYGYTRSGLAPMYYDAPPPGPVLAVRYYAPKPAWMTHIPGALLRFVNRYDFDNYLARKR